MPMAELDMIQMDRYQNDHEENNDPYLSDAVQEMTLNPLHHEDLGFRSIWQTQNVIL